MDRSREIIIGAINKSPSEVEAAFSMAIKNEILNNIEAKRAEVGNNILIQARKSADD